MGRLYNIGKPIDMDQQAVFLEFQKKLEATINSFGTAFLRLSTRSPKDAVDHLSHTQTLLVKFLKEAAENAGEDDNELVQDNLKLISLRRTFIDSMKCENIQQALDLFMYSSRTVSDMRRALDYRDKPFYPWDLHVIVREWIDIAPSQEYRGFVCGKKLNALSQYYDRCFFSELQGQEESICQRVQEFFTQEIVDRIQLDEYIIDFLITPDRIWVVELNPFTIQTGSCLFDWVKDIEMLKNGPFELRITTEINKNVRQCYLPWTDLLEKSVEELQESETENGKCVLS